MTIFKKRNSHSQVSPLEPPPASTSTEARRMSMQPPTSIPNGRPQAHQGGNTGLGSDGFERGSFRGPYPVPQPQPQPQSQPGSYQMQPGGPQAYQQQHQQYHQPNQPRGAPQQSPDLIAGPAYGAGSPVERVQSQRSKAGSEKSEKRKSGFFGFGRKDKDKDKKEDERRESLQSVREQEPQPRSSFSVNREPSQNNDPRMAGQPQRFSSPLSQNTQPGIPPQQRAASASDFGQGQMQGQMNGAQPFPKSQSMGFNQNMSPNQPQQYRGSMGQPQPPHMNAENRQYSAGSGGADRLPKSTSMPLDRQLPGTPPTNGTSMTSSPSRGSPQPPGVPAAQNSSPVRNFENNQRSRAASNASGPVPGAAGSRQPDWMKEYAAIVDLIGAQPSKTYMSSPPELEMILARTSAGGQPKQGQPGSAANDWDAVWLQLSGISLSMWSMKETRAAASKGEKVPPTYFNITDSSLELLAALPPPPHRPNSHPHLHVFSLNTAGSNRLLFSCPSERDISRWATSLRLAAWERARLEEIYTGHLIKQGGREPPRELVRGRMEGWVRVRVMGGTDWKRLWAVLSVPGVDLEDEKKTKRKSIFGFGKEEEQPVQEPNTGVTMASFYAEQRTAKNRATAPVLTITNVTQAYAVFPERLEVISQSNLMKVVGRIAGDMVTIEGRLRDSGWALVMPESADANGSPSSLTPLTNMMKWVTGFHDVFGLYGRPDRYNWDERNPRSLFFAYPRGPDRNNLFLSIDEAVAADHRAPNLPSIRMQFVNILRRKLEQPPPQTQQQQYPNEKTPPVPAKGSSPRTEQDYRLPSMPFEKGVDNPSYSDHSQPRSLSPITERTDIASRNNSQKTTKSVAFPERTAQSKQGSGSSKLSPTREQAHLESISDADSPTGYGSLQGQGQGSVPMVLPVSAAAGTAEVGRNGDVHRRNTGGTMQTAETNWSQSSGPTPVGQPSHAGIGALTAATGALSMQNQQGPQSPLQDSRTETSPNVDAHSAIHSPIPRKASAGEIAPNKMELHDEPAARYLMNMVDEPVEQEAAPPAQPVPPKNAASEAERVRPVINTDLSSSRSPPPLGRKPSGARAIPQKKGSAVTPRLNSVEDVRPNADVNAHVNANDGLEGAQNAGHTRGSTYDYEDAHAYLAYADQDSPTAVTGGGMGSGGAAIPVGAGIAGAGAAALPKEEYEKIVEHVDGPSGAAQPSSEQLSNTQRSSEGEQLQARSPPPVVKAEPVVIPPVPAGTSPIQITPAPPTSLGQVPHNSQNTNSAPATSVEDHSSGSRHMMRVLPPVPQSAQSQQQQQQQQQQPQRQSSQLGYQDQQPQRQASPVRPQPQPQSSRSGYDSPARGGPEIASSNRYQPQQQQQRSSQFEPPQPAYMDRPRSRSPGGNQMPRSSQYEPPQAPFMDQPRSHSPGVGQQPQPQHRSSSYSLRQTMAEQQNPQHQAPSPARPTPATNPSRNTMWNANFASGHGMPETNKSGKFVELDEPQAQLTKAFAPHGLLQAGLQDKEERSARKQEELAREMGASLVNVPSKPPPPSAGLLGAVAQHEKERKGAGGIGATLTDREREKRLAEERQREMEKMQRQQMEQGGFGFQQGFNPYMGMPMMGMPNMGHNPYQQGYNPYAAQQAMFAAQMAYNNAMMAHMSTAGSQAGHGDGRNSPAVGSQYGGGTPNQQGGGGGGGNMSMYGGMMPWMNMGSPSPQMMGMGMPGMQGHGQGMGMGMGMPSSYNMGGQQGQGSGSDYMGQQFTGRGSQGGTPTGNPQQQQQGGGAN